MNFACVFVVKKWLLSAEKSASTSSKKQKLDNTSSSSSRRIDHTGSALDLTEDSDHSSGRFLSFGDLAMLFLSVKSFAVCFCIWWHSQLRNTCVSTLVKIWFLLLASKSVSFCILKGVLVYLLIYSSRIFRI